MKAIRFIKHKILYPASFYTVFFNLTLLLISYGSTTTPALIGSVFCAIFAYFVCLATTNLLLHTPKMNTVMRVLLHFTVNAGLIFILMKIVFAIYESNKITQVGTEYKLYIVGFILFALLYLLIAFLNILVRRLTGKIAQAPNEYKPMFDKT